MRLASGFIAPSSSPRLPRRRRQAGRIGRQGPGREGQEASGGGQKIAGAEGKLGKMGKEDHTELTGEIKPATQLGGLSEVLNSDTATRSRRPSRPSTASPTR